MTAKEWLIKNRDIEMKFTGNVRKGGWLIFKGKSIDNETVELQIVACSYDCDVEYEETCTLEWFGLLHRYEFPSDVIITVNVEYIKDRYNEWNK